MYISIDRFTVISNQEREYPSTSANFLVWNTWNNEWVLGFKYYIDAELQALEWNRDEVLKLNPIERRKTFKLVS